MVIAVIILFENFRFRSLFLNLININFYQFDQIIYNFIEILSINK